GRRAVADRDAVRGAGRACPGDGRVQLRRLRRRHARRAPRRRAHGRARLAVDLPDQPPDRDGRPRARPATRRARRDRERRAAPRRPRRPTVTGSVILTILGCVKASSDGWRSITTLGLLAGGAATL